MSIQQQAQELLDNSALSEIMTDLHKRMYIGWCKAETVGEREKIHSQMVATTLLYNSIRESAAAKTEGKIDE